jgi:hypothetical protein
MLSTFNCTAGLSYMWLRWEKAEVLEEIRIFVGDKFKEDVQVLESSVTKVYLLYVQYIWDTDDKTRNNGVCKA